jgi:hypothetical protein
MNDLVDRTAIANAAMSRFRGAPLEYGKNDCVRMAAFVLRKRGHRVQLGKAGSYKSALGAKRALTRAGHDTIEAAIDAIGLERIPPAAALPCDVVLVPGEGPFGGALGVAVGNGRLLGWCEECPTGEVLQPLQFVAAWRV